MLTMNQPHAAGGEDRLLLAAGADTSGNAALRIGALALLAGSRHAW